MTLPMLSTKLHIPRVRAKCVSRQRLTEKLQAGVKSAGSLMLLSAPAGFGKTTLLAEFISDLGQPAAWVSLDAADNDPIQFWTYLITACQSIRSEMGQSALALLQTPQPLPDGAIPTILINDIDKSNTDLVLVLDDYHVIQNQAIHSAFSFFLDHLPDNLHLVISTRVDPPWPLARLRARDQLVEIRAADLRFRTDEAAAFLNQVMALNLSEEDVAALETRTEGWIASLQLAAISMKGRSDISAFIRAFTGSHTYVAEYLIEEVLGHQPEDIKRFLLQTSILSRMNASLCDFVTGRSDSETILQGLCQANLFVHPLDDEGQWFRYHRLFADLLKSRLQQSLPVEAISLLHLRAADWYEQAGMTNEAIEHALAAADYSRVVELVEQVAMPMILKAYFKTVEDWLKMIPPEYLEDSPRLNMAYAWMHLMRRNFEQAAPPLDRLQKIFSTRKQGEIEPSLQGEWLALQSMLLNAHGKAAESRDLAEQALEILPQDEPQLHSITYMSLASAYQQLLDYEQAGAACEKIIQHGRASGDLATEVFGVSFWGKMLLEQGQLHATRDLAARALQQIENTNSFSPFSATLYGELAQVHYHWHQLEKARRYFSRSVEWSRLGGFSDAEIYHSVFLSRLFKMEGNLQSSFQEIEQALDLMKTAAPALVGEEVVSQQVSICLALDRLAEAQNALEPFGFSFHNGLSYPKFEGDGRISHPAGLLYNSALCVLLYQANVQRDRDALRCGVELADRLSSVSLRCRHIPLVLQTLLLRAQFHSARGDPTAMLADVLQAVQLAASEGFISIFVEEGLPIAEALASLRKRKRPVSLPQDYISRILEAFSNVQPHTGPAAIHKTEGVDESLLPIAPLTPRELEVLTLIAGGDSNQAIAEKLVITLSAVKKHTGNIFNKLNVDNRTQAVAHARKLGLLSSDR